MQCSTDSLCSTKPVFLKPRNYHTQSRGVCCWLAARLSWSVSGSKQSLLKEQRNAVLCCFLAHLSVRRFCQGNTARYAIGIFKVSWQASQRNRCTDTQYAFVQQSHMATVCTEHDIEGSVRHLQRRANPMKSRTRGDNSK